MVNIGDDQSQLSSDLDRLFYGVAIVIQAFNVFEAVEVYILCTHFYATELCKFTASGRYQSRDSISQKKKLRGVDLSPPKNRSNGKQFEAQEGEAEGLPGRIILTH